MKFPAALEGEFELMNTLQGSKVLPCFHVKERGKHGRERILRILPLPYSTDHLIVDNFHKFFSKLGEIPNRTFLPTIYRVSGLAGQAVYEVEELAAGITLPEFVDRKRTGSSFVSEVIRVLVKVCEALHHAHHKDIFHLCITPEDIRVDEPGGKVKLVGFGTQIFCTADRLKMWPERSKRYIAPELMRGANFGAYSDVYSLAEVIREVFPELLDYDELRDKVLSNNPIERYQRIRQLEDKLSEASRNTQDGPHEERPAPSNKPVGGLQPVLRIITEPPGANVKVNGRSKGVTARTGLILPWHQGMVVSIEKPGYKPETLNLKSRPERTEIKLRLRPIAATSSIPVPETTRPHEVSPIERRIASLLEESEDAEKRKDWRTAIEIYEDILMLSPGREDVERLLQRARKKLHATSSTEAKGNGPGAVRKPVPDTHGPAQRQEVPAADWSSNLNKGLWIIAVGIALFLIFFLFFSGSSKREAEYQSRYVRTFTDRNFQWEVLKKSKTKCILIAFCSERDSSCRSETPMLEELVKDLDDRVVIGKVDVDQQLVRNRLGLGPNVNYSMIRDEIVRDSFSSVTKAYLIKRLKECSAR